MSKTIHKNKRHIGHYAAQRMRTLSEDQLEYLKNLAAADAAQRIVVVSAEAAKKVFKEYASNPKMEEFILKILSLLEYVGQGELTLTSIAADVEATCKIAYDFKTETWTNLKSNKEG